MREWMDRVGLTLGDILAFLTADTPKVWYAGYLPTSQTVLATVGDTGGRITEINLVNNDSVSLTPTIRVVPFASVGAPTAGHNIYASALPAGASVFIPVYIAVEDGDEIKGDDGAGDGSKISCRISGVEFPET
jgi:hypothetical protein